MKILKNFKNELNSLQQEYKEIYIQGFYVYAAWNKPVNGKMSTIIHSDIPDDLIHEYKKYAEMEELKYVSLGIDYEIPNCIYPCSRDIFYKKAC